MKRFVGLPGRLVRLGPLTLAATLVATGTVGPVEAPAAEVESRAVALGPDARRPGWSRAVQLPVAAELVGFDWSGAEGAVELRVRTVEGWSGWAEVHGNPDEGPDPSSAEHRGRTAAGPVWVGRDVRDVEVRVAEGELRDLRLHALDSPPSPPRRFGPSGAEAAMPASPTIVTRAQWGADESWRTRASGCDGSVDYASTVRNAYVHHTDNVNTYSAEEAAALIRGVYQFHTHTNGWCDIGYNFLIDRFGRVYEGRFGGVDKAVIGAHTGGFNTGATGVSLLGSHGSTAVPPAARSALVDLLAWKLGLHGVDTRTTVQVTSGGSSRYPQGRVVTMPTIAGHRDASLTACPGEAAYALLPQLRVDVQRRMLAGAPSPLPGWSPRADAPGLLTMNAYGGLIPAGSQPAVTHRGYWGGFPIARAALREANGGLVLDGWGGLHAFGDASPRQSSTYWPGWDIARDLTHGPVAGTGWILDGYGGFHPFGGIVRPVGGRYFGWDIARAMASSANGTGGYVLDGFGGLHPYGTAAAVTITGYWNGWDIARDVALRPDGRSGWVLDGWGGLHAFGGAPAVSTSIWWPGSDTARRVVLDATGNGGWVVDDSGGLWPFGGAPALKPFLTYTGTGLGRDVVLAPPAPSA